MDKEQKQTWMANVLILVAVLGRLIPHPANFTPVGAISLVGGAKLSRFWRWTIPFIALALSDLLLNLFFGYTFLNTVTPFIYGAFAVNILLGRYIRGNKRYLKLGVVVVIASLQFFLLSNFGVWAQGWLYARTWEGFVQCYIMALPYFQNSLLGNLCWSYALFAVIERSQAWITKREPQNAPA